MNSLRYKLMRFMSGRYGGSDKFNYFLLGSYLFLWILNIIIRSIVFSLILDILMFAVTIYIFFRIFSKNIYKRKRENDTFIIIWKKVFPDFKLWKSKWRDRKTHIYKKCPQCKAVLRLKRIKGTHTTRCPRCNQSFEVNVK